ncbi:carbohydrate-binding protein [Fibrobacter sp. UWB1]|uniref:carbohydrate-binding protein n=1 Tax=Fibrobacter sp. UWB1 TaxID=1964355 RepID=UPI000B51F378|nr:carbohydrate-binding protein [Fibrobacter sp. UWB1]OWV25379.1 carbohydrate-binding protein [Fibrobacter sp. UWB1]
MDTKILSLVFGCTLAFAGAAAAATQATFYVSPSGNDAAAGTKDAPFKTITQAQKAVRAINGSMTGDIEVILREGTYVLPATVDFTEADGGKDGHYVRYKAADGEKPLITGGMQITGWTIHDEANNIWKAEGVDGRFRQLYVNNRKAVRACFPNVIAANEKGNGGFDHDFVRLTKVDSAGRAFDVSADYIKNIKNIEDVEIHLMIAWSENILRLEKAQVNGGTAKLIPKDPERTKLFHRAYPMLGTAFMSNPPKQQVFYLENSYDLIDAPGEWYLDEKNQTLYYKPREGESMATAHVVAPRLNTLFSVLGKDTKNKVGYMSFEGLIFAHSNYTRPSEEGFLDLQAANFNVDVLPDPGRGNWEKLNSNKYLLWRPDAAFRVENAHHFLVQGNVFSQIAATGLDFVSGTNDDMIQGNAFFEIGAAGIMLGKFYQDSTTEIHIAYNPSDKDEISTRDTVKNNLVTNVTNEHQGAVGIGAGYPRYVVIEHNEVSYTYYSGISIGFGWTKQQTAMTNNHVNWNEIHHIARLLCDSGPIYTLSNQGTGSEIQHNYIHDNGTSKWADYWNVPIYLDEGSSGFTVKENVFKNSPAGVGQNQAGQNTLQQSNNYYSDDVVNNAGIEKAFRYIRDIKEIPLADFNGAVTQEPYKAIFSVPGFVQLEDYDMGGQSVSFYDKDFVNEGGAYREDGVDIVQVDSADASKGYAIGYTQAGEWLEYSVNVVTTSKFVFRASVADGLEGGGIRLFIDGKAVTDTVAVPQTEDWNTYTLMDGETSEIEKGDHVLRVQFTGSYVNLDWIQFALTKEELNTTGIRKVPTYSMDFMPNMQRSLKVYGANGRFMGSVEPRAGLALTETLKAAGFAQGIYMVRGSGAKALRVQLK